MKESNVENYSLNKSNFLNASKSNYSEGSLKTIQTLFHKVERFEQLFNKDLYDFNLLELKTFLASLRSSKKTVISSNVSRIRAYTDYARSAGLITVDSPGIDLIKNSDFDEILFKAKFEGKFVTYDELFEIVDKLKNYQDKVILVLAWNGIMGEGYKDMLTLKTSQFCYKNSILKLNNGQKLKLDGKSSAIVYNAINECKYLTYKDGKEFKTLNEDSPYIIKGRKYDNYTGEINPPLKENAIKRRMMMYKKILGVQYISNKSIWLSGIAWRLINLEKKSGKEYSLNNITEYLYLHDYRSNPSDIKGIMNLLKTKIQNETLDK